MAREEVLHGGLLERGEGRYGEGGWGEGVTLTTVPECPSKRATTDWLLISHTTILLSCEVCNGTKPYHKLIKINDRCQLTL